MSRLKRLDLLTHAMEVIVVLKQVFRIPRILLVLIFAVSIADSKASFAPINDHDCEGNACGVVTLTWENDKQQFKVQNDSDRVVRIDVTTFAGDSMLRVEAHSSAPLLVKSFNGPYRANFD